MMKRVRLFLIKIISYLSVILMPFKSKIKFVYDEKMINYILENKLSLIRFGDGEYNILLKKKRDKLSKI